MTNRNPYRKSDPRSAFYDPPSRRDESGDWLDRLGVSAIIIAAIPLFMVVFWGLKHLLAEGTRYPYDQDRWQMVHWFVEGWNFFGSTPWLWLFFFLPMVIVTAFIIGVEATSSQQVTAVAVGMIGTILCVSVALPGLISRDKVPAQFYQRATTWYVSNPNDVPPAVKWLVQGGRHGIEGCDITSAHDVPGCVKRGTLPDTPGLWQGRTSSYNGAQTVLTSSTADQQGADLMEDSLTYLGGESADTERWSGVIDGSGAYTSARGVVEWYGKTGQIKKCLFNDRKSGTTGYRFNRSFGGAKRNSLSHMILSTYKGFVYTDSDVWGKCEGNRPVFQVPMAEYKPFHHQMFLVPAGVLEIRGSASGTPVFKFRESVKSGELGGPAIPASIVERQRETLDWAAGRKYHKSLGGNNSGFGFDVATGETQEDNPSEYRLFNTIEKRWYLVTPLTPNNPRSQTYTALALTPSDEVVRGRLPAMKVYTLDSGSPQEANADRLVANTMAYLSNNKPFFKQNDGKLKEIVPLGGDMWRIYAQIKGYTQYYIDISATGRVAPTVVEVKNIPGAMSLTPTTPVGQQPKVCEKAPKDMSTKEKTDCIKALVDGLANSGQK